VAEKTIQENQEPQLEIENNSENYLMGWLKNPTLRNSNLLRVLLVLLIIICSLWLAGWFWLTVQHFAGLLLLFLSAWLLALILAPVVRQLIEFGLPKGAAIGLAYLMLIIVLGLLSFIIGPDLISQTTTLVQNIGPLTSDTQKWLNSTTTGLGLGTLDLNEVGKNFQGFATDLLKNALTIATGLAGFVVQLLLVTIISASLLAGQRYTDKEKAKPRQSSALWEIVPQRWGNFGSWLKANLERNFGVFLGGQLFCGLLYGFCVGVAMRTVGLPYALTTAFICAIMMLIPLFGGPLSLSIPLLVCISANPGAALIILPVLFIIQTVLLNVVLPKIVGQSSGLGPIATLFVLLAGAQIGGIWGVILGVPLAGVVVSTADYLFTNFSRRSNNQVQLEVVKKSSTETITLENSRVKPGPNESISKPQS